MTTNVLVTLDLEPALAARIEAVDPGVRLRVLGHRLRERFEDRVPYPMELQALTPREEIEAALGNAEVVFAAWSGALPALDLGRLAPRLRWVQLAHAGAERVDPRLLGRATLTTAAGTAAVPIAEWVLGCVLMLAKGWPTVFRDQQAHTWRRSMPREIAGTTVGIVGLGAIGTEVARLARAFGCRVIGMRRNATQGHPFADEVVAPERLAYLLGASDAVVLAAPLTDTTRALIDAHALASMRPHAVLINVARGELVDEAALVEALRAGRIGGAALDVFAHEPLPADSPLWDLERIILTPHIAAGSDRFWEHLVALFCDNLGRYVRGEPLANVLDVTRGY